MVEPDRGAHQPARRRASHDRLRRSRQRPALRAEPAHRDPAGAAARLAPAGAAPADRRRSDVGLAVRLRPLPVPQPCRTPRTGNRTLFLPAQAGEPSRGALVERRLHLLGARARRRAGHHPGDRADRDHPRRLRDGRDPLRAARALGRPELRPLGLHLQLHQEVPRPSRIRAAGPRPGDHGAGLHARLHDADDQDLPSPRRPRHRRHGGPDPQPPRPAGQRAGARQGARGQGARGHRRARRHLGRPSPGWCRSRSGSSTRT